MQDTSPDTGTALAQEIDGRYQALAGRGLKLDMTRGKPAPEQLDLAAPLLTAVGAEDCVRPDGTDVRNYPGSPDGLAEARAMFAAFLEVGSEEVIVGGNSSLAMMHGVIRDCMLKGTPNGSPWAEAEKVRFLCPVPGYDRHFTICEYFGIEMVPVPMDAHGPMMDEVEAQVADDPTIRGMWCVPKYSNPTGITYSDEVIARLSRMHTAAADFRLFFDNAYAVHHLYPAADRLVNLLEAARDGGHPDRALIFGSTSKISFAGGGVAMMGASPANIAHTRRLTGTSMIGPDQINQLRHVKFFGSMAGIEAHMRRHAELIRPKFEAVDRILTEELGGLDIASWTRPNGGYFLSLDTPPGLARRTVQLAGEAGVKLTPAGATFPYGHDPDDRNIRIAPTVPPVDDVTLATELLAVSLKKAWLETRR